VNEAEKEWRGVAYAGTAYAFWGFVPLYWRFLRDVGPIELTVHRVFWCAVFAAVVTLASGQAPRVLLTLRSRRLVAVLALTSLLITANWTLYIYGVATNQLVDMSLGYYMTPLISFALGVAFFGERMSRLRAIAVGLAALAVAVQTIGIGHLPWIAPALAVTFGLYGYFRKLAPVAALDGLLIETLLLFPVTLALIGFWAMRGTGAFTAHTIFRDALLVGSGPLTAVPLALFAAGARRIRMTTLGFVQYLSPSITLLLAVFVFREPFTRTSAIAFGCVWTALALTAFEWRLSRLKPLPAEG